MLEPRAPAPIDTGEASGGVRPASHRPAMPLPQRGGGRKKKQGKEKKREEIRKKKGRKEKGKKRKVAVVSGRRWAGHWQPDKPREGPVVALGHHPLPFPLVRVNQGRQREGGREREREDEGERTIGGPPLTPEPNWLPYTGSGLATCSSARRARASGTSPHRHWGGIQWGPAGHAIATKRWREEEEIGEGEEKRRKKEEERKKRKRKEKEGGHRRRPALGRLPAARQALGGASNSPRPPSTSLSLGSGEPGATEREREREGRGWA